MPDFPSDSVTTRQDRRPTLPGSAIVYSNTGHAQRCYSPDGRQWTDEAEEAFFDELALTGNVCRAAEKINVYTARLYRMRRARADFAAKWDAALDQAYARLEFELVRAAHDSFATAEFDGDRPLPRMSVDEALRVLSVRTQRAEGKQLGRPGAGPAQFDDVRDSILKKVKAIRGARPKRA